eukprot:1200805-Amphidinium_carterae.2
MASVPTCIDFNVFTIWDAFLLGLYSRQEKSGISKEKLMLTRLWVEQYLHAHPSSVRTLEEHQSMVREPNTMQQARVLDRHEQCLRSDLLLSMKEVLDDLISSLDMSCLLAWQLSNSLDL